MNHILAARTPYWLCFVGVGAEAGGSHDEAAEKLPEQLHPLCALQTMQRIAHVAWNRR